MFNKFITELCKNLCILTDWLTAKYIGNVVRVCVASVLLSPKFRGAGTY